ncbi:MAG: T9SS type A sorting domain-containing protein [Saprospiraceae bacterium]|nr:T9SS type A sorting domain-containing protein [Saprospiraceae bacterium]
MKKGIFIITIAIASLNCFAQDGSLDLSFDIDGIVTTSIGTSNDFGNTVVIQSDGKIIVAGKSGNNLALVRYNINGSLDYTFGNAGIVVTNLGCANASGSSCVLQRDGKIVVGGYCGIFPNRDFALTRYNSNGTLDNTFGNGGTVITPILTSGDLGNSVAIQSDGKILLGGSTDNSANSDMAIIRYNTNGTLDNTFDSDGIVITAIGTGSEIIRSVAVQADGKIVVAGFSYTSASFSYDFIVARYNSNGSLDNTFGTAGIRTTSIINSENDYGESIAIQHDGKIIVGGYSFTGYLLMARYNINGSLDPTFGNAGKVSTDFRCAYPNNYSVALQKDGKILIGGYSRLRSVNSDFALARYDISGRLDNSFGAGGILTTSIGAGDDIANSVAIQSDGKIVLAGITNNGLNNDFAVVRYNNTITTEINTNSAQETEIDFYPNPFSTETILHSSNLLKDATLSIYNSFGQIVKEIMNISGQEVSIARDKLPSGLYLAILTQDNQVITTEKLLIVD